MVQLRIKHAVPHSLYLVCSVEEESISHALVTCQIAKDCWDSVGIHSVLQQHHSFFDWCISNFQMLDKENPKGYLSQWKNAHSSGLELLSTGLINGDGAEHWVPPTENTIKVNVDAAIFETTRQFGIGWAARDTRGVLISGHTRLFNVQATPELAEAVGIREVLSWIKTSRLQQVVIETDCLSVVQPLRSSIVMISTFGQVVNDCKALLIELKNVSIYFIRRSVNTVAHEFARAFVSFPDCKLISVWILFQLFCYLFW
ncbi:uncharacterized protein LOC133034574 [Cannabis sativa]|uniref:uncharacterized protein LOC133034574 n=1 Tax=Cannabis sativa TaxID=3483 RepID=UPI0029C9DBA5|nr:uncharacterized protein LOC133034574 [Cannabis sativa]